MDRAQPYITSILVATSVLREVDLGRKRQKAKRVSCVDGNLVAQRQTRSNYSSVTVRMSAFRYPYWLSAVTRSKEEREY